VVAYLAEFIFGHRAVEKGTPIINDRQQRSHLNQAVVAPR